jgi:hypothetical protein
MDDDQRPKCMQRENQEGEDKPEKPCADHVLPAEVNMAKPEDD